MENAEIPVISMGEWILEHLRKHAPSGKIAQIFADDGSVMTYEVLLRDSIYVAEGLKAMGLKSGETVSFVTRNCHELFPVLFGFLMTDVLIAASVAELSASELRHDFAQINPNYIVTTKAKISEVEKAVNDMKIKPTIYNLFDLFTEAKEKGGKTDLEKFEAVKIADPKTHSVLCLVSSGTTGLPKAVVINDYGYIRAIYLGCAFAEKFQGAIMYTAQPYWATWWLNLLRATRFRRTRIFFDKLSPDIIAEAIHKYKPDVLYGLPNPLGAIHRTVQESHGQWDTSSLKAIVVTGEPFDAVFHEENTRKFGVPILNDYGTSEIGLAIASSVEDPVVYGSIGKPSYPVKLVDVNTGRIISEPNTPGELRVQWTSLNGYLNNPEATREAFDEDGWFKTGDVFYFNEDGHYFMVDRLKDIFKHHGFPIAPGELAAFIRQIPGVTEAVVVGKPDHSVGVGHLPAAFIVKAPDSHLTEMDVHRFFEKEKMDETRRLAGGIFFVNEIPKNPNGKLMKRLLLEMLPK